MRRSAAPSAKPGLSVRIGSFSEKSVQDSKDPVFPKAARSTASILSLLESEDENEDNCPAFPKPDTTYTGTAPEVKENTKPERYLSVPNKSGHVLQSNTIDSVQNCQSKNFNECLKIFNVVWGKQSTKKHKTWEGDGILEVSEKSAVLKDCDGKILGTASRIKSPLEEGSHLYVGNKEVEILDAVPSSASQLTVENQSTKAVFQESPQILRPTKRGKYVHSFAIPIKRPSAGGALGYHEPLVMPRPNNQHQV